MTVRRSDVAGRGTPKQGRVSPRRRDIDRTLQNPSTWPLQRPTSFCPTPIRRRGLRVTQLARRSRIEEALLSLDLSWVHRARRPAGELLICQFTRVRQATTGATAAGDHGKVPRGRPEVRASRRGARGQSCLTRETREVKGLIQQAATQSGNADSQHTAHCTQ